MLALISPHSPRRPGAFGVWAGERLGGSFAQFNAPGVPVSLPNDAPFACQIVTEAGKRGLATWMIRDHLDHGALVPLWFLARPGGAGPTVILSLTDRANSGLNALGEAIAAAARAYWPPPCHRRQRRYELSSGPERAVWFPSPGP